MSGTCPDCGSAGQANRECATRTSELLWDGGAVCTGISSGTLNDVIREMANSICAISSIISNVGTTAASVAVTGQTGGCIATSATLDTWIGNVETYLCALSATVAALDFTEPLYYNDENLVVLSSANPVVTDTIVIPANTLNETGEYLRLEIWGEVSTQVNQNCKMTVAFLGATLTFDFVLISDPSYQKMKVEITFVRDSGTSMQYDWTRISNRWKNYQAADYSIQSTSVSPVSWIIANNMVISCNTLLGTFSMNRVRLTKFNIH